MKPSLQFRLSQHLTLTPQLQQSIRLLQLSTVELNQEIERLLMDNPVLEREDAHEEHESVPHAATPAPEAAPEPAPGASSPTESEWPVDMAGAWRGSGEDDEDGDRNFAAADTPTLREHLRTQLSLTNLAGRDRVFVQLLIDALDEDGYLTQPLEEIATMLPAEAEAEPNERAEAEPNERAEADSDELSLLEELSTALRHLQNLEPAGVGARSPGECLCLQLLCMPEDPARPLALEIAGKHLELLASRDYTRLKSATGASDEALRAAQRLIQGLNPRPGAAFAKVEARYVIPDVIVRKHRNAWRASLNPDAMPRLRINRLYAELAAGARASGNALSSQLQEARWLIKNVQQRFETILRVSQAIVERQRHFFEHGEVAMRPLVLREIAETLSLHESTISRVTTQKYMATPRGTYELKYFFGSHVATDAGGSASSTAIRALIKQLVAAEDAKTPLSDARISQVLAEQGIVVARRTIAKYRESLQIPPVNKRKSL
jgi:RNA polymerase sigma-54 factor